MISTFTTPAVTSQAAAAAAGVHPAQPNDLALIAVLTFLALVIQKEATGFGARRRGGDLGRGLNIGIVPLSLAFAVIVGVRIVQMFA